MPLRSVTIQAVQSSAKSRPAIISEKGPLRSSSLGSSHSLARVQEQAVPQHSPPSVQTTPEQGAIARHSPSPSQVVPAPQLFSPQPVTSPARVQAAPGSLHSPLITSQTWSGPQTSPSCP